jgi:hypothetical protein
MESPIGEGVVDCDPVAECDYTKIAPAELGYHTPETIAIVFLTLDAHRSRQYCYAPLPAQVWPLAQDFAFEVIGESVFSHQHKMETTNAEP